MGSATHTKLVTCETCQDTGNVMIRFYYGEEGNETVTSKPYPCPDCTAGVKLDSAASRDARIKAMETKMEGLTRVAGLVIISLAIALALFLHSRRIEPAPVVAEVVKEKT